MKRQTIKVSFSIDGVMEPAQIKAYVYNEFLAIHRVLDLHGQPCKTGPFALTHIPTGYKLTHAETKKQLVARIPQIIACGVSLNFTDPNHLNNKPKQKRLLRDACLEPINRTQTKEAL